MASKTNGHKRQRTKDIAHVTYTRPLIFEGPCPRPEDMRFSAEVDKATVQAVERQTRGQMVNQDWFSWRKCRITASIAHLVSHSRFANGRSSTPPKSCVNMILGESLSIKTKAMIWGIDNEAKAVQKYRKLKSRLLGRHVMVRLCGLFIDPQRAWLGASPDRIVEDKQTGELCLEVICPYKHRENTMSEACQDKTFCLELGDEDQLYRLKTDHKIYTQVQCQMAVTGIHKADLAVFTKETVFVPVTFDPESWDDTVAKLEKFYREGILPLLEVVKK